MKCKHRWIRTPDGWECSNCFASKIIIKGVATYWDKNGYRITNIEDDGENDIAIIEKELNGLRKQ